MRARTLYLVPVQYRARSLNPVSALTVHLGRFGLKSNRTQIEPNSGYLGRSCLHHEGSCLSLPASCEIMPELDGSPGETPPHLPFSFLKIRTTSRKPTSRPHNVSRVGLSLFVNIRGVPLRVRRGAKSLELSNF